MRTTVTLDADVVAKLRTLARERGISFKEALNSTLRLGIAAGTGAARPYRLATRPMGLRPGIELDKAFRLADELEEGETIRKLEIGK